ncbi:tyrosinase family oxidase copper chaperone [Streptomyces sp. NPDC056486]|uniref:tyrosinase family oxidase copper chaperone n=1 Tax=Streptomyces sp. NPDC056486 TaxID=3345835 RepID=UPI0036AB8179
MAKEAARDGTWTERLTRRATMRGLITVAVAAVTAPAALFWSTRHTAHDRPSDDLSDDLGEGASDFDEMYEGRHIRGSRAAAGHQHADSSWDITVDGRPLHLMRRADGGYLSMIDHYESYPTPLIATRRAVDELGRGRQLRGGDA